MKLVYTIGPFRAKPDPKNQWVQWENVRKAAALSLEVWKLGASCICPHLNTAFFEGAAPADTWLKGDLEQLRRCDAAICVDGWQNSVGSVGEVREAEARGIPVFLTLEDLAWWLNTFDPPLVLGCVEARETPPGTPKRAPSDINGLPE